MSKDAIKTALEAYEAAFSDLFAICLSNPVYNAWGKQVDMTKMNEAHMLASRALAHRANINIPALHKECATMPLSERCSACETFGLETIESKHNG